MINCLILAGKVCGLSLWLVDSSFPVMTVCLASSQFISCLQCFFLFRWQMFTLQCLISKGDQELTYIQVIRSLSLCKLTYRSFFHLSLGTLTHRSVSRPSLCKLTHRSVSRPSLCKLTHRSVSRPSLCKLTHRSVIRPSLCKRTRTEDLGWALGRHLKQTLYPKIKEWCVISRPDIIPVLVKQF